MTMQIIVKWDRNRSIIKLINDFMFVFAKKNSYKYISKRDAAIINFNIIIIIIIIIIILLNGVKNIKKDVLFMTMIDVLRPLLCT